MLRSALLTASLTLTLALSSGAQVNTNGGYGNTLPQGAPSVPAITTPTAHVGPEATPQAEPGYSGSAVVEVPQELVQRPGADQGQNQPGAQAQTAPAPQPFNFGVAQYDSGVTTGDMGQPLGQIARDMRQRTQAGNVKTFTNADIQRIDGSSGKVSGIPNQNNDQWPDNNGMINSGPTNSSQQPSAAPSANPAASPFAPKGTAPAPGNNGQPQANAKPSAAQPYEMAQNNPSNAGIPQSDNQSSATGNNANSSANANAADANASSNALPKTASRLPLLGVLGFFSISMGFFVRYQRAKDSR
jgi:hypothetical protein